MASSANVAKSGIMVTPSPLAFIFSGNEMIVQVTANTDDEAAAVKLLQPAMHSYGVFNDGKHAAIVRCLGSNQFWITGFTFAQNLDKAVYSIVQMSKEVGIKSPTTEEPVKRQKVSKIHIRRPRNQFIIYRQWMSAKLHAENPGLTAACISQVVAQLWRNENLQIRLHFKALADEEDRRHKAMYPGYRYEAARRNPQPALSKRNLPLNPMRADERLIAAGF